MMLSLMLAGRGNDMDDLEDALYESVNATDAMIVQSPPTSTVASSAPVSPTNDNIE